MKSVFVLLACVGLALASYEAMFAQWMVEHNKHFTGAEYTRRLAIFSDNAKYVERHNSEGHSWQLGLNQFAALTNEEYRALYLQPAVNYTVPAVNSVSTVSTNVDWTKSGAVTGVKDQGQCGSCWTFSATGGIEGGVYIASGKLTSLSEQQILDCAGITYGNLGCGGGTQQGAFKYVSANGGITTESLYPYTATKGTCKTGVKSYSTITGYQDLAKSESALQESIIARPTPVAIDASLASFQLYKSGVYCPTGCSSTNLDHAVLATGMQKASGGTSAYYIVKNSWGTSWGQSGYIWMCADSNNNCGIATSATYPTGCKSLA